MRALAKALGLFSMIFMLTACGGGGSVSRDDDSDSDDSGGGVTPTISVSLTIENANGETDRNLTATNTLTVVATVADSEGDPQADRLLTFTLSNAELAEFGNDTGTARTNESGVATLTLVAGTVSGDGEITASLSSGETGSTTFTSSGNGGGSEQPADMQLYASAVQMASSGSDQVELIALIKNEQSILMEGVEVSFSAENDAGVELQLTQSTTAEDGTARALLSTQNDASERTVMITAQTGSLERFIFITITGTEVTINGPGSVIVNDTAEYILRVQDSDGVAIPNQTIEVEATNGTLSKTSVTTEANGQAKVYYNATVSGKALISASALNVESSIDVQVQQDEFSFVELPNAEVHLNEDTVISVQWLQDGVAVQGNNVTFSTSRGDINGDSVVATNAQGIATITVSSDNAGFASITATGNNNQDEPVVNAVTQVEFIAVEPFMLLADATPDLIGPDGQTSTITAVVRDTAGNLVKGTIVNFNVDDVSTGSISPSQATTDSNGVASTVFTSGAPSSEDGVKIVAEVAGGSGISDTVFMTVGDRAFDISIGTGNEIETPDSTSYLKRFAVFVSDSAGRPVSGVSLTASSTPVKYANGGTYKKGYWQWNEVLSIYEPVVTAICDNEDINGNGILDSVPLDEDYNGDGFLTPGIVGTLTVSGTGITDENGQAELVYRYPENYGFWYDIVITIFGQSTGSEASQDYYYTLGVAADDLTDQGAGLPANPYGQFPDCTTIN